MKQPDIVFFMVDQLSAKWFTAARARVCPTPHIDRLAGSGVCFSNAFTSNPVCCPARATLATGLTTRGHGVLENGYALSPELPTFMQTLQQAGWRTGALGKVHLRPHYEALYPDCRPYGFDVVHNTEDSRGGEWLDWVLANHPDHYEKALATIWAWNMPEFSRYGPGEIDLATRIKRIREGFHWATARFPKNDSFAHTLPFPEEVSQTNWITGHALDFIRNVPRNIPLFAHVSYVQPHLPFSAPEKYMATVDTGRIPPPVPVEWLHDPHAPRELRRRTPEHMEQWEHARHCYFADIAHLDVQLGRIMAALEEAGRLDNTFIVLLSDHGELLGDHGLWGKEEKHYDAAIHIPLVIAGPGLVHGAVCDEFVQLEDICPTVLDMTGRTMPAMPKGSPYINEPEGGIPVLPGRSLLPLCRSESVAGWRDCAYSESYNFVADTHPGQWARTIRTREYRYTLYPDGWGEQLFDLINDPDETVNLLADPTRQRIRRELRDRLLELIIMQDYPKTRRSLWALGVH